jgi:hypothetical protein
MTNPTDSILQPNDVMKGDQGFLSRFEDGAVALNFKPSGIEKYGGSNLAEWLGIDQLTIEAAGGDSYIMANNLPICLSSSARAWLIGGGSRLSLTT